MRSLFGGLLAGGLILTGVAPAFAQVQGAWTATGFMTSPRESDVQVALTTGNVLAAGGYDATSTILSSAEIYNRSKGTWALTGSMAAAREAFAAVVLKNGEVLVSGGYGATGVLASAELFNPKTNSWSSAGSMAVARHDHTATLLKNGRVLVTGGCLDSACATATAASEIYNPATNSWSPTGSLNTARAYQSAVALQSGLAMVIGGYPSTATTELYDLTTGRWTYGPSTSVPLYLNGTTVLADGKVLVTGGANGKYPTSGAELYNPATNSWSPTANMTAARYGHSATLLPDGTVLLAGGYNQSISCGKDCTGFIPTASAEIFTEATGTFAMTTPLNRALAFQSTTLMKSGQALTAGGTGYNAYCCQVVSDAAYYTPLTMTFSASSINFGFLQVGLTTGPQTVTVTNVSPHSASFTSISASGDFAQTNTCPATLSTGQSCSIAVTFTPAAAGVRSGAVTLADNDPGSPTQTITLSGTGESLALGFSPAALNFGTVTVGSAATQTATLINDGAAPVTVTGISVSPGNGIFKQTNTCPATLAVQQSCSFAVTFTPPDVASYKATLSVTNSAGAAASLSAAGTGADGGGG